MGWIKKAVHKIHHSVKKDWRKIGHSVKRLSHGRFHIGHQIRSTLPKSLQKQFDRLRWSKVVKSRLTGNNSALSFSDISAVPGSAGYVHQARRLSEMV